MFWLTQVSTPAALPYLVNFVYRYYSYSSTEPVLLLRTWTRFGNLELTLKITPNARVPLVSFLNETLASRGALPECSTSNADPTSLTADPDCT